MAKFKSLRLKIIRDELFDLYRQSHSAWTWADAGPQHKRYAEKIDERIVMLENKLAALDMTQPHSVQ